MMRKKEEENWKYLTKAEMQSKEKRLEFGINYFESFQLFNNFFTALQNAS